MAVRMYHPNIAILGEAVDDQQFAQVWEPRGWLRAPDELTAIVDQLGTTTADLTTIDRKTLLHIAAVRGVEDAPDLDDDALAEVLSGGVVIDTEPLASGGTVDADTVPLIGDPHVQPPAAGLTVSTPPPKTTTTGSGTKSTTTAAETTASSAETGRAES